jgi:hypothetical protein
MWAFRTLKNTISNILSDRFTHSFSLVTPVRWAMPAQPSQRGKNDKKVTKEIITSKEE